MLIPQLAGVLFFQWQLRAVRSLPVERPSANAALDLGDERTPRLAWLAPVPPFVTLGLLVWLSARWSAMLVRDTLGYAPGATAWQDPAFRAIAQLLLFGVGWSVWFGIFGLTMWHGMSRRYTFRRAQLDAAVAAAWSTTLLWPAVVLPMWLRLPPLGLLLRRRAATGPRVPGIRASGSHVSRSSHYFDRYIPRRSEIEAGISRVRGPWRSSARPRPSFSSRWCSSGRCVSAIASHSHKWENAPRRSQRTERSTPATAYETHSPLPCPPPRSLREHRRAETGTRCRRGTGRLREQSRVRENA